MTSLEDRVKGHKTQTLNTLENIIAVNDDGLLDITHVKKIARAIVNAHGKIDWDKLKGKKHEEGKIMDRDVRRRVEGRAGKSKKNTG